MPHVDSVDKVVGAYFAAVTDEPFTYDGRRYAVPRLTVSTGLVRGYTCPPGCGGCCPRFSLDYVPGVDPTPYDMTERTVVFDGREVTLLSDLQDDHRDDRCRNLDRDTGRCGVHGEQPFSCDFELIRVVARDDGTAHMTQRLFSRGWNMKRTDGGRGALCEITPADPSTVADVKRKLTRLDTWAAHFGLRTRIPTILDWIDAIADAPESHDDLVLPGRPEARMPDDHRPATIGDENVMVAVAALHGFPGNAKRHALDVIAESIRTNGQYRPLVVRNAPGDDRPIGHNCVLAGNGTWEAARDRMGWTEIKVNYVTCDDATARRINVVDNRAPELGGYDIEALAEQLGAMDTYEGTGYDVDSARALLSAAGTASDQRDADEERRRLGDAQPSPRDLPLDAIFTISPRHVAAFIAADCGLMLGVQSDSMSALTHRDRFEWKFPITFVDNEWRAYDHDKHRAFVEAVRPKYATTRDIMTPEQCAAAGIEHYPIEQILEWADDLAGLAENVIVIPKADVIDDIPEQYVLGYSVPTSYGGTPLPAARFKGRRVHLLGGSWRNQLRYLAALGDDVVSLDFNHCNNISQWGQFVVADGSVMHLRDLYGDNPDPSNVNTAALALSLGNIGRAIFDLTRGRSGNAPDSDPERRPAPDPDTDDDGNGKAAR